MKTILIITDLGQIVNDAFVYVHYDENINIFACLSQINLFLYFMMILECLKVELKLTNSTKSCKIIMNKFKHFHNSCEMKVVFVYEKDYLEKENQRLYHGTGHAGVDYACQSVCGADYWIGRLCWRKYGFFYAG